MIISQIPQPGECSNEQDYLSIIIGRYLANHVIETRQAETEFECGLHCVRHGSCVSVNYKTSGIGKGLCEFNSKTLRDIADHEKSVKVVNNQDFSHLYVIKMV